MEPEGTGAEGRAARAKFKRGCGRQTAVYVNASHATQVFTVIRDPFTTALDAYLQMRASADEYDSDESGWIEKVLRRKFRLGPSNCRNNASATEDFARYLKV